MNVLLAILLTIGGFVFIWAVIRLIAGPATPTANRYTYEVDAQGNEYVRDHTDRGYAEAEVEKAIDPYVAQIVKHVNERGPSASAFTGKGDLPMPELLDWIDEKNIRSTESEKANAARVSAANESLKRKADTTSDQTIPVVLAAVAVASVLDSSSSNYDSGVRTPTPAVAVTDQTSLLTETNLRADRKVRSFLLTFASESDMVYP